MASEISQTVRIGPSARIARRHKKRARIVGLQLATFAAFIFLWQLAAWLELYRPIILKSPTQVWGALVDLVQSGVLQTDLSATITATVMALVLAAVVGVPLGLMLGLLPTTERVAAPFIDALNATPRVAFAPVFIIIFGLSMSAKVALAFSIAVFVLLVNSRAGVHNAEPEVLTLVRTMGAKKREVFFKVLLPAATPTIFAGLRLGLIYSLLGVVTSELIASRDGMGQLIAQYSAAFQMDRVYAVILVLVVVASLLNWLMTLVERRLLRWRSDAND